MQFTYSNWRQLETISNRIPDALYLWHVFMRNQSFRNTTIGQVEN